MLGDVFEMPVGGYQIIGSKAYGLASVAEAREAAEYAALFRRLELERAAAESPGELRRVKRRHARAGQKRKRPPTEGRRAADRAAYRRANPLTPRECAVCGTIYAPRHARRMVCSERCAVRGAA